MLATLIAIVLWRCLLKAYPSILMWVAATLALGFVFGFRAAKDEV